MDAERYRGTNGKRASANRGGRRACADLCRAIPATAGCAGEAEGIHQGLQVPLGLPTFVGDDTATLRARARANLGLFPNLPFFRRLLRASGIGAEADLAEQGGAEAALSDRVLDAICLMGPLSSCRQRLAEYRDAGVDLPILWPAVDAESARATVEAFRQ